MSKHKKKSNRRDSLKPDSKKKDASIKSTVDDARRQQRARAKSESDVRDLRDRDTTTTDRRTGRRKSVSDVTRNLADDLIAKKSDLLLRESEGLRDDSATRLRDESGKGGRQTPPSDIPPVMDSPLRTEGAFKVFNTDDYTERDEAFYRYYRERDQDESVIAIMDTGIFAKSQYLRNHMKSAIDVSGRNLTGETYIDDISDFHGTKVAGQAAYGANKIGLIDLRVQTGQVSGVDNSAQIAEGLREAIDQGAMVVTCSIDIDWSKPVFQDLIREHPEVLFITTAGNNDTRVESRNIDGTRDTPWPNALLVGGVTLDGKKHPNRGFGPAVDITVPSGSANDSERALQVNQPLAVTAKMEIVEVRNQLDRARSGLDRDVQSLERAREAKNPNPSTIKRNEKYVTDSQNRVDELAERESELRQQLDSTGSEIGFEAGVSFGLPVIANIAAKMRLINPEITAAQIVDILKKQAVSTGTEDLSEVSSSGGIVDPLKAYEAAHRLKLSS